MIGTPFTARLRVRLLPVHDEFARRDRRLRDRAVRAQPLGHADDVEHATRRAAVAHDKQKILIVGIERALEREDRRNRETVAIRRFEKRDDDGTALE